MADLSYINKKARDYMMRDFGGLGRTIQPTRRAGPVPYEGQITSYLPQRTSPAPASNLTNMQRAGISTPQSVIDAALQARGAQPQKKAPAGILQSMASSTMPSLSTNPFVKDVKSLASGISSGLSQVAANQAQTQALMQAARTEDETDLSAFGGFGGDVTGLEPFGGSGDYEADLAALAQSLASEQAAQPKGRGSGQFLRTGAEEGELISSDAQDATETATTQSTTTTEDSETDSGVGEFGIAYEDILKQAMKETEDISTGEDTPEKDLEYYKNKFAEATGVNIDGKVDKSQALMALGLSLMQNKAGKGFNVGKMLSAVGEAGEKAMPVLAEARKEARAAQVAAGKYALNQVASDKAAEAANAQSRLEYIRDIQKGIADSVEKERLELLKGSEARRLERLKTELKIFEEGSKPPEEREYGKDYDLTFASGQGPATAWKIKMAYDKKRPDQAVLINADPMVRKYIDGRGGIDDAIELIDVMDEAARGIAEGGGTVKFAFDRANSIAKALFPDLNTGNPTKEEEYTQALNMIMGRFKRFLTQETGNGISNRDVDIWEREIMKKPTWFQNYDATSNALKLLKDTFIQKREEFDAGLDHLYNPDNHRDINAYNSLVEKYGTLEQAKGMEGKLIFKNGKLVRG